LNKYFIATNKAAMTHAINIRTSLTNNCRDEKQCS